MRVGQAKNIISGLLNLNDSRWVKSKCCDDVPNRWDHNTRYTLDLVCLGFQGRLHVAWADHEKLNCVEIWISDNDDFWWWRVNTNNQEYIEKEISKLIDGLEDIEFDKQHGYFMSSDGDLVRTHDYKIMMPYLEQRLKHSHGCCKNTTA